MTPRSDSGVAGQRDVVDNSERLMAESAASQRSDQSDSQHDRSRRLADWRTEAGYLGGLTIVLVVAIGGIGAVVVQFFPQAEHPAGLHAE